MKKNIFFRSALLLIICNLIGKVLGALYKIPLANIVGSHGMGQYQLVFPVYCLILTVSTSGIPIAISKLVAQFRAEGRMRDAKKLLFTSAIVLTILSVIGSVAIIFAAKPIAGFQGNSSAYLCYYGIAPAVVFVGMLSAFRGYFQGNLLMYPTAISGLIEQAIKVFVGLFLANKFLSYGIEAAVFGALVGVSISELAACVFLVICYFFVRRKQNFSQELQQYSKRELLKKLFAFSLPITLGGLISPITAMIDSFLVVNLLMFAGQSSGAATALLGIQAGIVEPLINLPIVIAVSISTAMLPNLSELFAKGEKEKAKKLIENSIKATLSISLCSAVCFIIFGKQLLTFVFGRSLVGDELMIAVKLLLIGSVNVVFLSLVQVLSSSLQAIGKPKQAVYSLLAGCLVKIAIEAALLILPSVGIFAVAISALGCYFVVLILNYKKLQKLTKIKLFSGYFYTSVQLCLVCLFAYFLNYVFSVMLGEMLALILAGSIAVAVFGITYYVFFIVPSDVKDEEGTFIQNSN